MPGEESDMESLNIWVIGAVQGARNIHGKGEIKMQEQYEIPHVS